MTKQDFKNLGKAATKIAFGWYFGKYIWNCTKRLIIVLVSIYAKYMHYPMIEGNEQLMEFDKFVHEVVSNVRED